MTEEGAVARTAEAGRAIICHCAFTVSDLSDTWAELVGDDDGELPDEVLNSFLRSARLVEDAMCERGYEVMRSVLESLVADGLT